MRITTLIAAVAGALALAAPSQAEFGFQDYSATLHDNAGVEVTQAGAHANSTVSFTLNTKSAGGANIQPDGSLRNVSVDMPTGFVGNPEATPRCTHRDFRAGECSGLTMVGVNRLSYRRCRPRPRASSCPPCTTSCRWTARSRSSASRSSTPRWS